MKFISANLNNNLTLIKDDITIDNNIQEISVVQDTKLLASKEEDVNLIFTNT
jgi:hypothetical protein